jgi:transcriptional regulator with XRE-family HTH domain
VVTSLADKAYRDAWVEEDINQGVAFQIRAMRDERQWTQSYLGELTGQAQATISKLEDPDYGRYTLKTLKRLASAFDVGLLVRFVPFSELVERTVSLSSDDLAVPSFAHDSGLPCESVPGVETVSAEPLARIAISPQHAKALAVILAANVRDYEAQFGTIPLHPGLLETVVRPAGSNRPADPSGGAAAV